MSDVIAMAVDERSDLLDVLATLSPSQWAAASLCEGWTVHDVVAHVVSYDELSKPGLAMAFLRGGLSPRRINAQRLARYRDCTSDQLRVVLRDHLRPTGLAAGMGGGIGLGDALIHHQDIRRALSLPRVVPTERLIAVLEVAFKAPVLPAKRNAKGLRLVADDIEWRHGDGPEVVGSGEALLMAVAGRSHALSELHGAGVSLLRDRIAR